MRTRLLLAFSVIIVIALVSTVLFERRLLFDFEGYIEGVREDQLRWVIASVEDGYADGRWDEAALTESVHWAMMMGFDILVLDKEGRRVSSSHAIMHSLSPSMSRRMAELFEMPMTGEGSYASLPLSAEGETIGTLQYRLIPKKKLTERERAFRDQAGIMLIILIVISGSGLLLLGAFLTFYLTRPVSELRAAAEKVAHGDFSARTTPTSADDLGTLASTFNRMAESLQREEDLRKRLMSNIAHELRTPLTVMKTQVEAVADGVIDRDRGLENIERQIDGLISLVKGMEDLTSAEASFFAKGEMTSVNLGEFLSGLADDLGPAYRQKGLTLSVRGGQQINVVTDLEKLERVMRNILSNALKFSESGGAVISCDADNRHFTIEVRDTGRGIAAADLPHIFTRFYRGGRQETGGLGLGLAIVKELVEVMGGDVAAESREGEGTTLRLKLPNMQASPNQ